FTSDEQFPSGGPKPRDSVPASEQFPPFALGKFDLRPMPTVAGEFSPVSPSGYSHRTGGAHCARRGEDRAERQELSPQGRSSKGRANDEDPGQEKAARGAPPCKARQRRA